MNDQCFTCGAERNTDKFRYVTKCTVSGSTYYSCNTECLLELAKSEREHNAGGDYLETQR